MRGRHNIVGSEVGRPKPPFYPGGHSRLQVVRPHAKKRWIILALVLASCLGLFVVGVG
jgi:hypothetical protein